MTSVLVTGFEPFDTRAVNASWEAVRRLPDLLDDVAIARLPVAFDAVRDALAGAVEQHAPRIVVSVGEAGGRRGVSIERVALNLADARIPDNRGVQPRDAAIEPGGPVARWTGLPVHACAAAAAATGVPAEVSYSAGTYVCNYVFYTLQSDPAFAGLATGFIHVPTEDVLDPDATARALAAAVAAARENETDIGSEGGPTA